jgi:hypothetical protein
MQNWMQGQHFNEAEWALLLTCHVASQRQLLLLTSHPTSSEGGCLLIEHACIMYCLSWPLALCNTTTNHQRRLARAYMNSTPQPAWSAQTQWALLLTQKPSHGVEV